MPYQDRPNWFISAVTSLAALLLTNSAAGALLTTAPTMFSVGPYTVTDSTANAQLTTLPIQQRQLTLPVPTFSPMTGLLIGATMNVSSSRKLSVATTVSGPLGGNPTLESISTNGEGFDFSRIRGPGVDVPLGVFGARDSCTGSRVQGCNDGASSVTRVDGRKSDIAVTGPEGSSYVGTSDIVVVLESSLQAGQKDDTFLGNESTTATLDWSGSVSITYEYILHSAPFVTGSAQGNGNGTVLDRDNRTVLDLDFGQVNQNQVAQTMIISIGNEFGDRIELDIDRITGIGDVGKFSTNMKTSTKLAPGFARSYSAIFDTSEIGNFAATYAIDVSDADFGVASTRLSRPGGLTLNLRGTVIDPAAGPAVGVSEPGIAWLAAIGLFALGLRTSRAQHT